MSDYTRLVRMPDPDSVNKGVEPCPTSLLAKLHGLPAAHLPADCGGKSDVTNPFWHERMRTEDLGPFRATGYVWALELFRRGFRDLKAKNPDLYDRLSSAGMLCVRHVRGIPGVPSNHSFGMALDIKIDGLLDPYNDGKIQKGLLDVYAALKGHGIFWGVEFRREDAMHFEVSGNKIREWIKEGVL